MNRYSTIGIEVFQGCNLKCPLCPTTILKQEDEKIMTYSQFENIVNTLDGYKEIVLFNWGEAFLHPEILKMVALCKRKGIKTSLHSNLNSDSEKLVKAVQSGLNFISASIDGISQKTYSKYRQGGNFDLAFSNLIILSKMQDLYPFKLVWRFIVNRYNEDDLQGARDLANQFGIEFRPMPIGIADDIPDYELFKNNDSLIEKWVAQKNPYAVRSDYGGLHSIIKGGSCYYLENQFIIRPNLNVSPCCMTVTSQSDFGNINEDSLNNILNNHKFTTARYLFDDNIKIEEKIKFGEKSDVICTQCYVYRDYLVSKQNKLLIHNDDNSKGKDIVSIRTIIKNSDLCDYLICINDEMFFKRLEITIKALDLAKEILFSDPYEFNTGIELLGFCNKALFKIPFFSMLNIPPYALIVLGGHALHNKSLDFDIEFMAYSAENNKDFADVFLPALLGIILFYKGKVDDWCIINILGGYASLTPYSNSIKAHMDYPILREYAQNKNAAIYIYSILGGGVFLDLIGKQIAGNKMVVTKTRINKLKLIRTNYLELKNIFLCLAKSNLSNPAIPLKYLIVSFHSLFILKHINNEYYNNILLTADNPELLINIAASELKFDLTSKVEVIAQIESLITILK